MKKASIICLTILLLVSSLFAAVPASAGALLKDREDFEWGIGGHNSAYPAYPERTYKEQVRLAAQMGCDIYRLNYNPTNMSMPFDCNYFTLNNFIMICVIDFKF